MANLTVEQKRTSPPQPTASSRHRQHADTTEITCVHHPDFDCPEAVHEILESLPEQDDTTLPAKLQGQDYRLPNRPLLSVAAEQALFLRMNLLRYIAAQRQHRLKDGAEDVADERAVRRLLADATMSRNEIVESNQRLVVSIAAKFGRSGVPLADLVSEANMALMKAVDRFDISRGNRLSTYATYAIRRHLSRYVQREQKRAPMLSKDPIEPLIEDHTAEWIDQHPGELVRDILHAMPPRERSMVELRFGLTKDGQSHTLHRIGSEFGISQERVRQLVVRSCAKAFEQHAQKLGLR